MATVVNSGSIQGSSQGSRGKKNSKRKKNPTKLKNAEEVVREDEVLKSQQYSLDEDAEDNSPDAPKEPSGTSHQTQEEHISSESPTLEKSNHINDDHELGTTPTENGIEVQPYPVTNGSTQRDSPEVGDADVQRRLMELTLERQQLQAEVTNLRQSLEEIREKHEIEVGKLRSEVEETQSGKEHVETQYRNLLGKLNTIRSQLGDRLKADAEELSQAKIHIEDLEANNKGLQETNAKLQSELDQTHQEDEQRSKELSSLRNRTNLSQQNWLREREDLISREALVRDEFEAAKQAMQDWEVLAMEERSIRESLAARVSDLEEQLSSQKEAYDRAASERDNQSLMVDGLQRALQDIQDARKHELRELVESNQAQVESLRKGLQESEKSAKESQAAFEEASKELARATPFEKEVKEKNLLIGKLRHEAVILNDHLTKALRLLRKGKPEDNVDRQIVTNHFLHFLALDRADPKKFQILQLIAALLNWTDEQREQAGLARPGNPNSTLRAPLSPFHRTPSTPVMASEFFPDNSSRKESLAELWSNFLEQEAKEDSKTATSPGTMNSTKSIG